MSGLVVSAALGGLLIRVQHENARDQFDRRTDLVVAAVQEESRRYQDSLAAAAAAVGAYVTLTSAKYAQVTQPLQGMGLAGATSVGFIVPATDDQIPEVQSYWRARAGADLVLHPAGTGEHNFLILVTALAAQDVAAPPGTDTALAPALLALLDESRRSGQVSASDTYHLISDQNRPAGLRQLSFAFAAPVLAPPGPDGRRAFLGWLVMGMHGQDFMGGTLRGASQNLLDVSLQTQEQGRPAATVAALGSRIRGTRDLHRTIRIPVANRHWEVTVRARAASLPGAGPTLVVVVVAAGGGLSLMLSGLVYLMGSGRARAEALVASATADLRRQKTLLEAIMDSVAEGIVVVDHSGEFILTNPAVASLLRVDGQELTSNRWDVDIKLFRPDGITPFPPTETPTFRALAGESSQGVEIIWRQGAAEVVLSVSARPLDQRAGRRGAVVVLHDITRRKRAEDVIAQTAAELSRELALRRETEAQLLDREAALTSFTGMVAHDLRNPLRSISGFTHILREDLEEAAPGGLAPGLTATLDRITGGVSRMGHLIEDLLAFATARDRALTVEDVDLAALTADVIIEQADLAQSGRSPGQPPEISVEPLPVVRADPVMCRQLLNNLIGNAIKYTAPGEPASIQISAEPAAAGWVRIEIADRGLGIPPGEHEKLFESFHRAHTEYPGTGLGLAICERIVSRHGGTITASDNPGCGSRFRFTLPTGTRLPGPRIGAERRDVAETSQAPSEFGEVGGWPTWSLETGWTASGS